MSRQQALQPKARIGIDLGGTKIEGIVLGPDGAMRAGKRCASPTGSYEATLNAMVDLVGELEREADTMGTIGIGIPGALSPATGLVKNANSTWLIGHPFRDDLERRLGRPVRIDNDANCFAVSEATDGAAAGADPVFGVILGTGVGGGLVVGGRPVVGASAIAGEWGHNPLPRMTDEERPGPPCYCGRLGCVEAFLSGPALARDHEAKTGERLTAAEIAARAEAGEPQALATLDRHAERLARALAVVVNILDPQVIVLGGGLSNIRRLYPALPDLLRPHVFSDALAVRIVPPKHGAASGVRGAAWLWPRAPGA
ncbi:MAG: ROK family protein [Alphaproteobacteria bacterium]|nr:ROK family protein [Alphaproteobacteria bacterium]